jgi:predicted XRE-type DNA-binding protein
MSNTEVPSATISSGNTFKDLRIPNPELAKIKSDIALAVYRAIQEKGLIQKAAASIMGVDQAKVSAIVRGITKGYTVERLMLFLSRLDVDVDIRLKPKAKRSKEARTRVTAVI